MTKLTQGQLKTLYFNFTIWRDIKCNGMASMSVQEFYLKFGLENPCADQVSELLLA
jgi:hypothetical protein